MGLVHPAIPASDIINGTMQALVTNNYRKALSEIPGESFTHMMLQRGGLISDSKYMAYAKLYNVPRMDSVDESGLITSRGTTKSISMGIELSKEGSVYTAKDLDYVSESAAATQETMQLISAAAVDYVWETDNHLLNNLDTGVLTCHNGEVPGMISRDADSFYMVDGVNIAPNMTGSTLSADSITLNYQMLGSQKSKDGFPIKNTVYGIIVDRSKYHQVAGETTRNSQFGTDLTHRWNTMGLMVGLADFKNQSTGVSTPNTWIMLASGMNMGTATIRGRAVPYIHTIFDQENQNVKIVTQWVHKNYCMEPYGFVLNKPA